MASAWFARNRREQAVDPPDETSTALVQALLRIPEAGPMPEGVHQAVADAVLTTLTNPRS